MAVQQSASRTIFCEQVPGSDLAQVRGANPADIGAAPAGGAACVAHQRQERAQPAMSTAVLRPGAEPVRAGAGKILRTGLIQPGNGVSIRHCGEKQACLFKRHFKFKMFFTSSWPYKAEIVPQTSD